MLSINPESVYKFYRAGVFSAGHQLLPVINPYSGETFAEVFLAGPDDLEKSIIEARNSLPTLKALSSYEKSEMLGKISSGITKERGRLANILSLESGKPLRYAYSEIDRAAATFFTAAHEALTLSGEFFSLGSVPQGKAREAIVKYFPVGVVAGIAPFNFPMNLVAHKMAPAMAAGCPIILKPSSETPLSALELARIIDNSGWPRGSVSVLPMPRQLATVLVEDPRIALLSFTGSPAVGWDLKSRCGKKKILLELGGNAGVIIAHDANLDFAIDKCITGAFAYSGQVCIHAQRFFVHDSLYDDFVSRLLNAVKKIKTGPPQDPNTDFSVMIDAKNADRVMSWINEAENAGASVLCGGNREGNLIFPTVISGVQDSMKVVCEEIFGPVITLEKYKTPEEAFSGINNSRFGLQAGIFTESISLLDRAFSAIEVGGLIHNDVPSFRTDQMPYGGIKESGLWREGVKYAMMEMMEPRVLVKREG
jgi:acyl-CoA reductase-like NAD-dependent aldehyde dehydrogenase